MRALVAVLGAVAVAGCATPAPQTFSRAMCLPCVQPCTPDSCNPPVAAPKPAPPVLKQAGAPTFTPAGGQLEKTQLVTIEGPAGATIRYTTDGTTPNASSPVYSGPIAISSATTVRAIASVPGQTDSAVASAAYDVAPPPVVAAPAPARVVVTKQKLELKDKIFFDTGKATIKPVSYSLLDEVAAALKSHDEVQKVNIEGHTDSVGAAAFNKNLSQQRAEAVRAYLVTKGIEGGRLEAKGFGEEKPVAPNKTARGREENRRVEFNIAP